MTTSRRSWRAGVKLESRRAVEHGELGELAWQGERSLGSRKKFTFLAGAAGAGKPSRRTGRTSGRLQGGRTRRRAEVDLGWGRGGLQGEGLHRKALWGDLEDGDEHVDGALGIMPP